MQGDRKSTRLNSSHSQISYAVFCLKKNTKPGRPSTEPVLDQLAHLIDARTPDRLDLLVGKLVGAAEDAIAEQLAHAVWIRHAGGSLVERRLAHVRERHALEPCPRKVLEPVRVARLRVDLARRGLHALARPPGVEDRLRVRVSSRPLADERGRGHVPAG